MTLVFFDADVVGSHACGGICNYDLLFESRLLAYLCAAMTHAHSSVYG